MIFSNKTCLAALAAVIVFAATAWAQDDAPQSAEAGGKRIELATSGRNCALQYDGKTVELLLPAPCRFLARGAGQPAAAHAYDGRGAVLLVAGPLAHPDDYARSEDRKAADGCSHMAQAVIVKDGALKTGAPLLANLGFCAAAAPDEKFYYGIAHADAAP